MEFERYQQLAVESFSNSWLMDRKPYPTDGNSRGDKQRLQSSFDFDVPLAAFPTSPVHAADEIFYNGHIVPLYDKGLNPKALETSTSAPAPPVSWCSFRSPFIAKKMETFLPGAWRKSSRIILRKCCEFVKPLCRRIKCSRNHNRVDDLERKVFEVNNSLETQPKPTSAYSAEVKKNTIKGDCCYGTEGVIKRRSSSPQAALCLSPSRSSDVEMSIHEAILYCKRSIEK